MSVSTPFVCDDCKKLNKNWYAPCPHTPANEAKGSDVRFWTQQVEEIRKEMLKRFSDYLSMEQIASFAYEFAPVIEARVQAAIGDEKLNPWKQAIIEALVVDFILSKANENDPKKALADLIDWNTKLALDPRVSSNAAALEQAAAFEMRERCAKIVERGVFKQKKSGRTTESHLSTDRFDLLEALRALPIPTDALDAMLLRARTDGRIEQHRCERGCVQCSSGLRCHIVEGLRGILERDLAALTQPAPEKERIEEKS